MKINYNKAYRAIKYRERLPRKVKKTMLGLKMSKNEIKKYYSGNTLYLLSSQLGSYFGKQLICPKCGCSQTRSVNHNVGWPEIYCEDFCARCGFLMNIADNSPSYNFLEMSDDEDDLFNKLNIKQIDLRKRLIWTDKQYELNPPPRPASYEEMRLPTFLFD